MGSTWEGFNFFFISMEGDVDNLEALFRNWSIDTASNDVGPTFTPPVTPGQIVSKNDWATEFIKHLRAVESSQAHSTLLTLLEAFEGDVLKNDPNAQRHQKLSDANRILYKAVLSLKQSYDNSRRNVLLLAEREKVLQDTLQVERDRIRELESQCETLRYRVALALNSNDNPL